MPTSEQHKRPLDPPVPESPVWLPSIAQGKSPGRTGSPGTGFTLPKTRQIPMPTQLKSNAELFSIGTLPSMEHLEFGTKRKKVRV
jgi:dynein heavy chain